MIKNPACLNTSSRPVYYLAQDYSSRLASGPLWQEPDLSRSSQSLTERLSVG